MLDEFDVIVPEDRLQAAIQNPSIAMKLSHSKLKAVIREIDGSKQKKKALWKRMRGDTDFRVFVDELLSELGYMNEHGQFEVKEQRSTNMISNQINKEEHQ